MGSGYIYHNCCLVWVWVAGFLIVGGLGENTFIRGDVIGVWVAGFLIQESRNRSPPLINVNTLVREGVVKTHRRSSLQTVTRSRGLGENTLMRGGVEGF